jgi:predicted  nucleic acid-binding Zn-ribbon protein
MNNKGYLAVIVALLLVCAYLAYNLSKRGDTIGAQTEQIDALDIERRELELDLRKLRFSYDTLRTENTVLMAEMADQRMQIDDLLKRVKDRDYSITKLKKETNTLREIMKGYVFTIDSLNQLNQALMAENEEMRTQVSEVTTKNKELIERQQNMEGLISTGQMLQTTALSATAIKLRSSGKQIETNRASKTEMLKACFTIVENRIAKPGTKTLYMRVVAPSGAVLPSKDGVATRSFAEEGELPYSVERTIDYNNAQMDVCIFYTIPDGYELEKGAYTFFIYEGDHRIGLIDLALK